MQQHFSHQTTRFAPAKINLGLHVLARRSDGYHQIDSLMARLDVSDTLTISSQNNATPTVELEVLGSNLAANADNLVYRAAMLYLQSAKLSLTVRISLEKCLPLASGLGGGSSDAAATLLALQELHPATLPLAELALQLGADVPFFLLNSAARAQGIGEILQPVALAPIWLVLLNPTLEISAKDAYTWLAERGQYDEALQLDELLADLAQPCQQPLPYRNSLQYEVVSRHPAIAQALDSLAQQGLCSPLMSGSGSTCFALAKDQATAEAAAQQLKQQHPTWWCAAVQTC